jgi:GTP cyclohydrolase II
MAPSEAPPAGELSLAMLGPIPLPMRLCDLQLELRWFAFVRHTELAKADELASELRQHGAAGLFPTLVSSMAVNSVLIHGDPLERPDPLVRVHSSCLTGDVFGSLRCECGPQLASALGRIAQEPSGGMVVYMAGHEGRGIGLWAKAATYLLQDAGENTYQANRSLGLPDDSREFGDAAAVLRHFLGDRPFRLLTNNPKKVHDLEKHGLSHITPVKHVVGVGPWNQRYLAAKRDWGHQLEDTDIEAKGE